MLLNIFKDCQFIAKSSPIAVCYDKWVLSNALWIKLCNGHGKYKPELNESFHMY